MKYQRITKAAAKKLFAANKPFYLCGCNMRAGGFWHPECPISEPLKYWQEVRVIYSHRSPASFVAETDTPDQPAFQTWAEWDAWLSDIASYTQAEKDQAWEMMYNGWAYYNTSSEEGYYAHYYKAV